MTLGAGPDDAVQGEHVALKTLRNRGRHKIFLGYAPGVGKTFTMLSEAQRRVQRGEDVVIGFVETHGRKAIAELAEGLPIVPRKTIDYRGKTFEEMDTAAVSISSKVFPRYSIVLRGMIGRPSASSAMALRPWVSTKPTTTSSPRWLRRCASASMVNVLPTPGA